MTPESIDKPLNAMASGIDDAARQAYARFLELLAQDVPPRDAMETIRRTFEGAFYTELSAAFDKALGERWTTAELKAYQVGDVTLSQALYANFKQTEQLVSTIAARHARGVQQARALALELYQGYGQKESEILKFGQIDRRRLLPQELRELFKSPDVREAFTVLQGRARAATLRTSALQSAYLQAFDHALDGAAEDRLQKLLKVAMEEKMRYFANRIAQTELALAHAVQRGEELLADDTISVVQWRLSGAHPRADICDLLANVDRYGLGKGCFPKRLAPRPIAHPFCRCRLRSRPDLDAKDAKERPGAELAYMDQLEDWQAARLVGSRAKLERVKNGETALDVWNTGKDERHQVPILGKIPPKPGAPPAPPAPVAPPAPPLAPVAQFPIPAFKAQTTVTGAAKFAESVVNETNGTAFARDNSGLAAVRFKHQGAADFQVVRLKKFFKADYKGLDVETANFINAWLVEAAAEADRLGIPRLRGINTASGARAAASMGDGVLAVNKSNRAAALEPGSALYENRAKTAARANSWTAADGIDRRAPAGAKNSILERPWTAGGYFVQPGEALRATLWHEFAHHIHQQFGVKDLASYKAPPVEGLLNRLWGSRTTSSVPYPSQYSATNPKEYFAECFSLWRSGRPDLVSEGMREIFEKLYRGELPQ